MGELLAGRPLAGSPLTGNEPELADGLVAVSPGNEPPARGAVAAAPAGPSSRSACRSRASAPWPGEGGGARNPERAPRAIAAAASACALPAKRSAGSKVGGAAGAVGLDAAPVSPGAGPEGGASVDGLNRSLGRPPALAELPGVTELPGLAELLGPVFRIASRSRRTFSGVSTNRAKMLS